MYETVYDVLLSLEESCDDDGNEENTMGEDVKETVERLLGLIKTEYYSRWSGNIFVPEKYILLSLDTEGLAGAAEILREFFEKHGNAENIVDKYLPETLSAVNPATGASVDLASLKNISGVSCIAAGGGLLATGDSAENSCNVYSLTGDRLVSEFIIPGFASLKAKPAVSDIAIYGRETVLFCGRD